MVRPRVTMMVKKRIKESQEADSVITAVLHADSSLGESPDCGDRLTQSRGTLVINSGTYCPTSGRHYGARRLEE
ncbi:unnamed protein product [Arctogadus glacialis]